jgi:16S rRNA (cytidine1402-2'-O)-methyltransferase
MVFYESPYRLIKTLEDFKKHFGEDRQVCVSRELTKIHEENIRGTLSEVIDYYKEKNIKGEIVLIIGGSPD